MENIYTILKNGQPILQLGTGRLGLLKNESGEVVGLAIEGAIPLLVAAPKLLAACEDFLRAYDDSLTVLSKEKYPGVHNMRKSQRLLAIEAAIEAAKGVNSDEL